MNKVDMGFAHLARNIDVDYAKSTYKYNTRTEVELNIVFRNGFTYHATLSTRVAGDMLWGMHIMDCNRISKVV